MFLKMFPIFLMRDCDVLVFYDHLAVAAIEVEGEALAVVDEIETAAIFGFVEFRTYAELVSDAVTCAHKFCAFLMSQLICIFYLDGSCCSVYGLGESVGNIALI